MRAASGNIACSSLSGGRGCVLVTTEGRLQPAHARRVVSQREAFSACEPGAPRPPASAADLGVVRRFALGGGPEPAQGMLGVGR